MAIKQTPMAILSTFLLLAGCQNATTSQSSSDEFVEQLGLSEYKTVAFRNETGTEISFEDFQAKTRTGRSFSIMKDSASSEAILQIEKVNARPKISSSAEPKIAISQGEIAPKIEGPDLNGVPVTYSDSPTLLSFFFSECGPCIKEIPKVNALARDNPHVQFVSITFDSQTSARDFVSKYGLKTRVVADEQNFIDVMGVKAYPFYALISKDGRLLGTQPSATLQIESGEVLFKKWIDSKLGT